MNKEQLEFSRISLFHKKVVRENFHELNNLAQGKIDNKELKPGKINRHIYNFVSSAIAWQKKTEKYCDNENIGDSDEFIKNKMIDITGEERYYFLKYFRGFYNHTGDFVRFQLSQIPEPQSKISIKPKNTQKLVDDFKRIKDDGKNQEMAYNYLLDNKNKLNIYEELKILNKAVRKTDKHLREIVY